MMCNSRLSSLHLVMDRDSSIESGVRKSKNTEESPWVEPRNQLMIDATTPEQARNRALEESDLGSQGGSMDTVEHSTGVCKKNGVIKSGGLNSNGGSDIGAHLEIEVVEHSTKSLI
ncbi:hypothetical protein MKW92_028932 [Papaver armeniacum]|nr:hypothetical protein MKW92_028932 [Papaver armeniacum]